MWNAAGGGILWLAKGCRRTESRAAEGIAVPTVVHKNNAQQQLIFDMMLFDLVGLSGSVAVNMF